MPAVAYVNGRFSELSQATVPIEDRGFQFADGVYEVIVAPQRRLFRLEQHLDRLRRSTEAIDLHVDYAALDLGAVIAEGIRRCGFDDVMVYLQITRGVVPRDHLYPDRTDPTVVATFKARPEIEPAWCRRGVRLETVTDIRWARCDVKSIALLPNVLLKNAARRRGNFDAVIVGPAPDQIVRETTCANVFIIQGPTLRTHPADEHVLHGVTRGYILECAAQVGLQPDESPFPLAEFLAADEVFISSTTLDLVPVVAVEDHPIGTGAPGRRTLQLLECFHRGMRPCTI